MPTIVIPSFGGEVPRTTPRLLENNQASMAINCQLERGELSPLKGPLFIQELEESSPTIFKHVTDGWLAWPKIVNVVKSAVYDYSDEKPLGQLFMTGAKDYPSQYLSGGMTCRLGIPRPALAPQVRITGTAIAPDEDDVTDSGIERSSSYCYTYIQRLANGVIQFESAPSPASPILDVKDGQKVLVDGFILPTLDGLQITHLRLYRTVSGDQTSEFHFLAEISATAGSYLDGTHDKDISSEVLQTATWDAIPEDAKGLILTNNGIYACFRGNELLLSEPNYSYAFPTDYRLTVEDEIVALGHTDNTIIVLTKGRPYLVAGMEPAQMQLTLLPIEQACVSARSVAHVPGGLLYASPDGLMMFTANEQTLATSQTFTNEQWRELGPENLLGTVLDGQYIGFFAGTNRGFIFTIGASDIVHIELPAGMQVMGIYHHSVDDCIYLSIDNKDGSHAVWQWEAGEPMEFLWRSKPFFTSRLTAMRAVRIEGEQDSRRRIAVCLYGGESVKARESLKIENSRTKRTTTTRAEKLWSMELRGKATVYEARLGSGVEELEYGNG